MTDVDPNADPNADPAGSAGDPPDGGAGAGDDTINNPRLKELSDENASWRVKFNELKQLNDDALAKLKAVEDKDKSELQRAVELAESLKAENEQLRAKHGQTVLENAFLKVNEHSWKNPSAALTIARAEGLLDNVVKDDGSVDNGALKKALENLARGHEYLVNPKNVDQNGGGNTPPSGDHGGGNSNNGAISDAERKRLAKKYRINR